MCDFESSLPHPYSPCFVKHCSDNLCAGHSLDLLVFKHMVKDDSSENANTKVAIT